MILDAFGQLSDSQVATTNTTTVSTNSVDLDAVTPKRHIGTGEPMAIVFSIEAITGAADTFTLQVISSTAAALNAGVLVHARSGVLTAALLPVGTRFYMPIPPGTPTQRYLGASYILGASDALTVSAHLVPMSFIEENPNYATAITIL
jgi:hypothetical protein